jgi:hypothetical protein
MQPIRTKRFQSKARFQITNDQGTVIFVGTGAQARHYADMARRRKVLTWLAPTICIDPHCYCHKTN